MMNITNILELDEVNYHFIASTATIICFIDFVIIKIYSIYSYCKNKNKKYKLP